MQRLSRLVTAATSRNDVVLAVFVIAIIFMMILPLPTTLVDVLIGTNITLTCVLLMVAIYLPSPLAFSSFPSVLLVGTLFRLGISIATTRLILLDGDAGHIIETFGNFVVGGNLVVGLVVFLILTVVQFIVVTKGAERVAEVAARFSLDAMPGKQMSIDADVRAGTIDKDEARRRRRQVEKESQLYGAMDGAMKFVKGDAIAGLIIVAVNLLGGLAIGVLQHGMSAADAGATYSILSIGDGLISQIPALLTAISAGIIVTRVPDEQRSNVGKDIGKQVMAHPRALLISASVALFMALIPGMPVVVFLVLAAILGLVGYTLARTARDASDSEAADGADRTGAKDRESDDDAAKLASARPLTIEISAELDAELDPEDLKRDYLAARGELYRELGIPLPEVHVHVGNAAREAGEEDTELAHAGRCYRVHLYDVPADQGYCPPDAILARESPANMQALGIARLGGETWHDPREYWVADSHATTLRAAGVPYLWPAQVIADRATQALRRYAADFLGIQEARLLLTAQETRYPELVKETQRIMPIQRVAEILQRLVSEHICIRDMRAILEALIEWAQKEKDTVLLTEYARIGLKRYISYKYANEHGFLPAYLLAPATEQAVRDAIRQTSGGSYLAMDPEQSARLLERIKQTVGPPTTTAQRPVLLTTMDIRRYVRKLIENDLYQLPVLSYQELSAELNIQPLSRIEL
ncbi:type III secretion system export apparatus subunit SctV [Achromobacter aloeverae]|uniref:EscV/YscV/HrcV family type III secretion system export apparatus protein n=1 Tax=Achromobacter aloeverae TaxID=1750518 RepID=A0A4Q1HJA2_9BURK|nr:type III secretion system export apparatus subunit SctV [Achromobacter aloeverae]RXN87773.1 EscV/YscV/HrcV family type III secretion system export apparatus protein [Achromobacter aloeverae]